VSFAVEVKAMSNRMAIALRNDGSSLRVNPLQDAMSNHVQVENYSFEHCKNLT
jgi:hypothetical protein